MEQRALTVQRRFGRRAVLLDTDIHAEDLVGVVPPNQDYAAFWRSMLRLAHEIAQNDLVVVCFSVMLPEQLLANRELLGYFKSVHYLCLSCPPDVLRQRLDRQAGREINSHLHRRGVPVDGAAGASVGRLASRPD